MLPYCILLSYYPPLFIVYFNVCCYYITFSFCKAETICSPDVKISEGDISLMTWEKKLTKIDRVMLKKVPGSMCTCVSKGDKGMEKRWDKRRGEDRIRFFIIY